MTFRAASPLVLVLLVLLAGCAGYVPGDAANNLGNPDQARALYEEKYRLGSEAAGLHLAEMLVEGTGGPANPARAVSIYETLAPRGVSAAEHNLGYCHEYGRGVPVNYAQAAIWYRRAADHKYIPSLYNLGSLYANDYLVPKNDIEGLVLLLEAAELSQGLNDAKSAFARNDPPKHRDRLIARMSAADVALAHKEATLRAQAFRN